MYEFKFKTILKYKKQIEESLQQDFAASKKRWSIERDKLELCYERWQKYIHDWREAQKGTLSIIEVDLYQDYMVALKQQMTAQSEVVKSCLEDMDKKRMLLLEGVKERKTLEQLDEKYLSEYLDHHKKLESKLLNDIATIRYNLDRAES
jgi:flagellar export protein FliJ